MDVFDGWSMQMDKRNIKCVSQEDIAEQMKYMQQIKELNAGKAKKYYLTTFGCQMNENDSEKLSGMLVNMGYTETDNAEDADVIIFNTCCVRENAESKVYGHLGVLKNLKREKPWLVIAVCGCMMQQQDVVEHIKNTYRHVDLIFGTHNLHKFPELLANALDSAETVIDVSDSPGFIAEGVPIERKDTVKAWVTVMYGCNNFCSYCIVPYVRGRERSRSPEDILQEVEELAKKGYKEVTLLGQNVNSYGLDLGSQYRFSDLLTDVNRVEGIERIRFMTSHPKDLSEDLIISMKNNLKVCHHLHLPIQSGSGRILEKMNRKYTKEQYLKLISSVKNALPDIALTTDIIVGFPGETDEDFYETLDVIEKVRYDMAFTFLYSKRKGTPAADDPMQVSEDVKKKRFDKLLEVQNRISKEINEKLEGTEVEVLVEGLSRNNPLKYTGRTGTNKIVNFDGNENMIGKIVKVKIEKAQTWSLEGTALK
mgnify:CR=1 FL=1